MTGNTNNWEDMPIPPRENRPGQQPPTVRTVVCAQCKECGCTLPRRFIVDNGVTYCPACDEAGGGT
jgi:hypothetical protein